MIREKMIVKRITILFGIVAVFGTIWMSQLIKNRGGVDVLHVDHYDIPKSLVSYHHFILIIGAEDGEYVCMDPLKDELTKLSDYSNRIYSVRCVWYSEE